MNFSSEKVGLLGSHDPWQSTFPQPPRSGWPRIITPGWHQGYVCSKCNEPRLAWETPLKAKAKLSACGDCVFVILEYWNIAVYLWYCNIGILLCICGVGIAWGISQEPSWILQEILHPGSIHYGKIILSFCMDSLDLNKNPAIIEILWREWFNNSLQ